YDDFMTKLLRANPNSSRTVLTVADSLQVRGPTANPHLWYDLPRIPAVAQVFEQALARADPADAALFTHNLQQFDTALQPSLTTLGQIKTQFAGSPVAYTERVPGYVLADAGLSVQTPPGFARSIEEGNEPSASDQSNMQALIVHKRIRALLYNAQATSPATEHIRTLAAQTGIPVVPVTETLPRQYHSFQEWQQAQLDELLHALQQ
ncbi:MAG TPA: zinc ABC transporter substrate-binding protein, partial [Candidatus Saccharimonadales bacterium]|nr:zinc ABC transporter substrate-binding protein [Candidatus Saccharimonadales bacterium]